MSKFERADRREYHISIGNRSVTPNATIAFVPIPVAGVVTRVMAGCISEPTGAGASSAAKPLTAKPNTQDSGLKTRSTRHGNRLRTFSEIARTSATSAVASLSSEEAANIC